MKRHKTKIFALRLNTFLEHNETMYKCESRINERCINCTLLYLQKQITNYFDLPENPEEALAHQYAWSSPET